jgi:hypothetical protein
MILSCALLLCLLSQTGAQKIDLIAEDGDAVIELQLLDQSGVARLTMAYLVFDQQSRLKHIHAKQLNGSVRVRQNDLETSADYYYDSLGRVSRENIFETDDDSTYLIRYGKYTYHPNGYDFKAYNSNTGNVLTDVTTRVERGRRTTIRKFDHAVSRETTPKGIPILKPNAYHWEYDSLGRASVFELGGDTVSSRIKYSYQLGKTVVSVDDRTLFKLEYDKSSRLVRRVVSNQTGFVTKYKYHKKTGLLSAVSMQGAISGDNSRRIKTVRKFKLHREFSPRIKDLSVEEINKELLQIYAYVPGHLYDDSRFYMFLK